MWVTDNPKKLAALVDIVKSGVEIGQAIASMTGGPVTPEDLDTVSLEQKKAVHEALDTTDGEGGEGSDWGEMTVAEAAARAKE